jgi:hypothetical protein
MQHVSGMWRRGVCDDSMPAGPARVRARGRRPGEEAPHTAAVIRHTATLVAFPISETPGSSRCL